MYQRYSEVKRTRFDPRMRVRVDDTAAELSEQFFPASASILKRARESANTESTPQQRDALIAQIKSDPAIFLYCVKHLNSVIENPRAEIDPIKELKALEHDRMRALLNVVPRQISEHRRDRCTDMQALRLQHSVVSACAAQSLSETVAVDSDLAFSAAVFRQLGLHLISWNKPKVYSEAMIQRRRKGSEIDQEVKLLMGVSPSEIGARLAMKWGLNSELRAALLNDEKSRKDTEGGDEFQTVVPINAKLAQLCQVSELYSDTKDPKNFPEAKERWSVRQVEIERTYSKAAFSNIEHESQQVLIEHAKDSRSFSKMPLIADEVASQSTAVAEEISDDFLRTGSAETKALFDEVNQLIPNSGVAVDAIRVLVERAIPELGFDRGCLFLLDKSSFALKPALRIGDTQLATYATFLSRNRQMFLNSIDSQVPLKFQGLGINGEIVELVIGALLSANNPGVLYLELGRRAQQDSKHASMEIFNLIRRTVSKCLGER